jgi:hypothetical protein
VQPTNPYAAPAADEGFIRPPERTGSFRRILNVGLHLYFTNLLPIAVVTLIVWTPLELFQAYLDYFVFDPEDIRASFRLRQFPTASSASLLSVPSSPFKMPRFAVKKSPSGKVSTRASPPGPASSGAASSAASCCCSPSWL